VFGRFWKRLMVELMDAVVLQFVASDGARDEPLVDVLEALERAGAAGGGGGEFWERDIERWRDISERVGASEKQVARWTGARGVLDSLRAQQTRWKASVVFLELVLRALRACRKVRESLMAVMSEDYFEVDRQWLQEVHRPVLHAHADLAT
jgi:hypothetical protein